MNERVGLLKQLQNQLNINFKNPSLLDEALTHRSVLRGNKKGIAHNERLEFFGDAVLKLILSEYLYHKYPAYDEGELSKLRSQFISDRFMTIMAKELQLSDVIHVSYGEKKAGGQFRDRILADAMEALLGASYLDQGLAITKEWFLTMFETVKEESQDLELTDYKTELQELCQKKDGILPSYTLIETTGPQHDCTFHVQGMIKLNDTDIIVSASGKTKKDAEQKTAQALLKAIEDSLR
ncbi:MAG: ribonuclease III [Rickettsiales bacterium]|nr:ribonuclease III [Rickettsiales bacterium]|tara:strand:+ start:45671 stop:46384 length:714 start_codon:yes stop_codon:yes gene_type:complete